jgi:hypothetical protein
MAIPRDFLGFASGLAFFFPFLHDGTCAVEAKLTESGKSTSVFGVAPNMSAGPWMTFIEHVLADLGAPAAYRAKAKADMQAMIGLGFFKHLQLRWFAGFQPGEGEFLP